MEDWNKMFEFSENVLKIVQILFCHLNLIFLIIMRYGMADFGQRVYICPKFKLLQVGLGNLMSLTPGIPGSIYGSWQALLFHSLGSPSLSGNVHWGQRVLYADVPEKTSNLTFYCRRFCFYIYSEQEVDFPPLTNNMGGRFQNWVGTSCLSKFDAKRRIYNF